MSTRAALRTFGRLLPALRPEWRGMLAGYLVATASALGLAGLAVLTAWAVGHAIVERTPPGPLWWAAAVGLVLLRTLFTWQEMDVSHALAYRVLARLRMALFDAYARSVPARRREHSGRAAAVAMGDIEKLEFFYAHTVAQLGASLTVFLASFAAALFLLPEAALVMSLGSALVAGTALCWSGAARRTGEREQQDRETLSAQTVDALGALREVLGYGLAPRIIAETATATARAAAVTRRRELLSQLTAGVRELIVTAVVIGVIAVSAAAAGMLSGPADARLSPAVLPALVALALAGVTAVTEATAVLTQLHPLTASARRVGSGINRPPVVSAPDRPQEVPSGSLGLRFRAVSFAYDDRRPTLEGWSADVAPGEHVGLAGPSGAGKSTIIALAARLWDPSAGTVELAADGTAVPVTELDDEAFRGAVALVEQDARLFHGTVRDNLLRGTRPRPDTELSAVLERVGAKDWADLDEELGEGGLRLSGGQQARLCLARALIRRPRVLLVDEITASLDPETERIVSDVIAEFDGTVLAASHRAETLARFERVVHVHGSRRSTRAEAGPAPRPVEDRA
ncbi:ABC transporter ATP-binding protein [Streptomonospora salina]|uniref:ABC-type transport system involved in cytochrome bd biosynthesis fused ATPase/permease subunit n=1 Tax=Streptomonospora salina TaxID=104205 RepID=A0A841EEH5_9ACTN|nr:ABC transporter ATP-binding protein [Streptomonospora salina]MBB6000764.1 ABC-type transport system involved in cytochrome bd biosynthesis fused ATPase/permease subunit [Streptomonospora salina]